MVQNISTLSWLPTNPGTDERAAFVSCDIAIDGTWNINILGNTADNPVNIRPRYLTVDNINNTASVSVGFGPFLFTTPPCQRETFEIPEGTRVAAIVLTKGVVRLTFGTSKPASDVNNQLLIQQTAVKTLIYGYVTYGTNQNQLLTDQNSNVLFNPAVAMTYSLGDIPNLPVGNGWFQFVRNLGTAPVTIRPFGGQFINGVFNNANPMVLNPGDSGSISSDGSNWYFQGTLSFVSAEIALTNSLISLLPHGLKAIPDLVIILLRCKVIDLNWQVGDEFLIGPQYFTAGGSALVNNLSFDATNIRFAQNTGVVANTPQTQNKTTLAISTLTAASWRWVLKANYVW